MAAISTHLHRKPFQVAVSADMELEFRKWNHLGTRWDVSPRNVAHKVGEGAVLAEHARHGRLVFSFSTGQFVSVGF